MGMVCGTACSWDPSGALTWGDGSCSSCGDSKPGGKGGEWGESSILPLSSICAAVIAKSSPPCLLLIEEVRML